MIDPYKVLGISQNATQDEIKKAYRKKAKEMHPDLHPDDPDANRKMNEVNEAYDMLQNPDKYRARQAQEDAANRQRQGYGYASYYNTSSGSNGYGSYGDGSQYRRNTGNSSSYGGWYSDFDFNDFFGFFNQEPIDATPRSQPGDSPKMTTAINYIGRKMYQEAVSILISMTSAERNARWYYVTAVAYKGTGDTSRAIDLMDKAVQLEPNNQIYMQLLKSFRREEQSASAQNVQVKYVSPFGIIGKFILYIIGFRIIMYILRMILYLFFH